MNDDTLIQQLRELKYPGKIDVTEAVMVQVRKKPLLVSVPAKPKWNYKRIVVAVAACVVLAVGVELVYTLTRSYDSAQIADDIATVYDFHADYADGNLYYGACLADALLN